LRAVARSLTDTDANVRDVAMRTLADWPDVSAGDELLRLSLEAEKPVYRSLALRGYLRLALEAKSGQAALLTKALDVVKTDADKRALLGALVESGQTGALDIAARLVGDAAVGMEAASAILTLASKVGRQSPLAAEAALKNLAAKCLDSSMVARAQQALSEGWSSAETIPSPYDASTGNERRKQLADSLSAGDKLIAYLDCGVAARAENANGIVMRLLNGKGWNFGAFPGNLAAGTVVFDGRQIDCAIVGLDPAKTYALGFTWWDADGGGRSQGVQFLAADEGKPVSAFPVTALPSGAENKPPAAIQVPVPPAAISQGRTHAIFRHQSGPNAVLSELWLIETPKDSRSATQVVQAAAEVQKPKAVDLSPFAEGIKILLVTGIDYPGHVWRLTAPAIKELLEKDPRLKVRIVEDPEALGTANLAQWDVVLLHFQNWEKPGPGEASRANLKQFVENGGGLISVHFACGAWHEEWPEFQNILGRVWHGSGPGKPQHDAYGKFLVEITDKDHPITRDLGDFETTDELYTCLTGDAPIHLLAHSQSKVDQKYHPQAFVRDYGKGRVFLTTLGHDLRALTNNPAVGELLRRSCVWTAKFPTPPRTQ
jgi:type 1 glutamine amidotransferase